MPLTADCISVFFRFVLFQIAHGIREAHCIVLRHLESYLRTKRALGGGWCKVVYGGVRLKMCAGGVLVVYDD